MFLINFASITCLLSDQCKENIQNMNLSVELIYSQVHIYLDTGTIFIILTADQNIFKLQLYKLYMILKCTL